jgi:hypothetical protein
LLEFSTVFPENEYILLNKNKSERGSDILENSNVQFVETSKGKCPDSLKWGRMPKNRSRYFPWIIRRIAFEMG